MSPAIDVDEVEAEVEESTPNEDFATPPQSTEETPSSDFLEDRNADAGRPELQGNHTSKDSSNHFESSPKQQGEKIKSDNFNPSLSADHILSRRNINSGPRKPDMNGKDISVNMDVAMTVTSVTPSLSTPSIVNSCTPQSDELDKEVARIKELLDDSSPAALHKILRQEWRVFLFTPLNEDHISFIIRACFKNIGSTLAEKALKDVLSFAGSQPVINSILQHATASQLLDQVPQNVLDEAVAQRLKDAPAKDIFQWLAESRRLGYYEDDILDKDDDDELVTPNLDPSNRPSSADYIMSEGIPRPSQQPPYHLQRQESESQNAVPSHSYPHRAGGNMDRVPLHWKCVGCGFVCQSQGGYAYHTSNRLCTRKVPANGWVAGCLNCGQTFSQTSGQTYHLAKKVCHSDVPDPPSWGTATLEEQDSAQAKTGTFPIGSMDDRPLPQGPQRPNFSTNTRLSAPKPASTQPHANTLPRVEVVIQRPPWHTTAPPATPQLAQTRRDPTSSSATTVPISALQAVQAIDPTARVSPSQLSEPKQAELNRLIQVEDARCNRLMAAVDRQLPEEDQKKLEKSIKSGNATRKSQIRKSFGVSIRLRDKDKLAARAATASRPSVGGLSHSSPHVPSHVASPSSGFSPINAPAARKNPIPPNFDRVHYPPPPGGIFLTPFQLQQAQNRSASRDAVATTDDPNANRYQPPSSYIAKAQSFLANKRQRISPRGEHSSSPAVDNSGPSTSRTSTPYGPLPSRSDSSTIDGSVEDAESKYPKKASAGEVNNGKRKMMEDASEGRDATSGRPSSSSYTRHQEEPIMIDSSSDDENSVDGRNSIKRVTPPAFGRLSDADKLLPSTEDTEGDSEVELMIPGQKFSDSSARSRFKAKRGGRSVNY